MLKSLKDTDFQDIKYLTFVTWLKMTSAQYATEVGSSPVLSTLD